MFPEAAQYKKDWQSAQQSRLDCGVETDSFVYLHVNADDGVPHHVGIGFKKGRPWETGRNNKHRNKVAKHGLRVEIVADNLTWEQACFWEVRWIKALRAVGYELTNLTDGGEGVRGYRHTSETLVILSSLKKGKTSPRKGVPHRQSTKDLLSEAGLRLWQNPVYAQHMSDVHKGYVPTAESVEKNRQATLAWFANATEEQLVARSAALSTNTRAGHAKRTPEQKKVSSLLMSNSQKRRAASEQPGVKQDRVTKQKITWAAKSKEELADINRRRDETNAAKPDSEKQKINLRRSKSLIDFFASLTDFQKKERGLLVSSGIKEKQRLDPDHWVNRLHDSEQFDVAMLLGSEKFIAELYGISTTIVNKLRLKYEALLGVPRRRNITCSKKNRFPENVKNYRENQLLRKGVD